MVFGASRVFDERVHNIYYWLCSLGCIYLAFRMFLYKEEYKNYNASSIRANTYKIWNIERVAIGIYLFYLANNSSLILNSSEYVYFFLLSAYLIFTLRVNKMKSI
jgi:hypothetical protein